ncbi:hypothetical protein AO385_0028 [Moraxella catarrhalis]|uniref:Uncharacterized protein n=1 Tax=Moraxella catarrhalis TaxID=480 RepID=A0A198UJ35_MORCA|nr:hypothetical protein AO384_0992 [Moraxella catarrhalis]OAU97246.1 hypothetical protein AO383_1127 [Moraxella catarrhalis]OAU99539.1 hypothetical protein AO382_1919 [Moraxella catarrhalis]OAV04611.1 hypothetical protein AO385_0028 [Moraxella catarrhalis]
MTGFYLVYSILKNDSSFHKLSMVFVRDIGYNDLSFTLTTYMDGSP